MKIERPDPRIGAIATDVDVRPVRADWNTLYRAWLDGIVLVVRGQTLTIEEFLAYSRRFGRLKPHRVKQTRHPEYPELTVMGVGTRKPNGKIDKTIYDAAAAGTPIRRGTRTSASARSSTASRSRRAAATPCSPSCTTPTRRCREAEERVQGLKAEHVYGGRGRRGNNLLDPEDRNRPPAVHPIVRCHRKPAEPRSTPTPTTSPASRASATPRARR